MAKNAKKTNALGITPGEFGDTRIRHDEHEHKQEHVHVHKHEHIEPERKENKKKHVHLLTYEDLIDRMDAYAAKRGVSRTAVFEAAMLSFLSKVENVD